MRCSASTTSGPSVGGCQVRRLGSRSSVE
jgi:hypothetical protein